MKKYKLTAYDDRVSIVNADGTWTTIKENCGNLWDEYQSWLKAGNKPEIYQTNEEKIAESNAIKLAKLNQILKQAINLRSGLEIQGDVKALEKSQTWYDEKVAEIEAEFS